MKNLPNVMHIRTVRLIVAGGVHLSFVGEAELQTTSLWVITVFVEINDSLTLRGNHTVALASSVLENGLAKSISAEEVVKDLEPPFTVTADLKSIYLP
jgi:hypothetical protein